MLEANYDAVMATIDPGDEVIVADPSYICFYPVVKLAGATVVRLYTRKEVGRWNLRILRRRLALGLK